MSDKDVLRGREAQAVLENEAFKIAMKIMKDSIDMERAKVSVRDSQGLVIAALWERVHRDFQATLVGMVNKGEFEQRKISDSMNKLRDESKAQFAIRKVFG